MTARGKPRSVASARDGAAGNAPGGVALQRHAVVERNLEKYPWSTLSDAAPTDPSQLELRILLDAAGEEGRAWTVSGTTAGRLPGPFESDLYIALCQEYNTQIARAHRGEERRVRTTYAALAQLMGRERGGTTYRAIRVGLERLLGVEIRAVRTWREGKYGARETIFHLIEKIDFDYGRPKEGSKPADGGELPVVGFTITFSEDLSASLADGNLRVLDTSRYFALETPTAKRLFRFLDQRRWFGTEMQQEIALPFHELIERLPIDRSAPSHVKRTLDPAHAGLIANGYLHSVAYEEKAVPGKKRGIPWVRYKFAAASGVSTIISSSSTAPSADARSDTRDARHDGQGGAGKGSDAVPPRNARDEASSDGAEAARHLIAEILGTLRDDHSVGFYTKVVRAMPEEVVRNVLGGVRQSIHEGLEIGIARKLFTKTIQARAAHLNIALSA